MSWVIRHGGWLQCAIVLCWCAGTATAGTDTCSNQDQVDTCRENCNTDDGPCASVCGTAEDDCESGCNLVSDSCEFDCGPFAVCCPSLFVECITICHQVRNDCRSDCFNACSDCRQPCQEDCARLCVNCDANGPYIAECGGVVTLVPLDASGANDPQGGGLTYAWNGCDQMGSFNDPSIATPVLTLNSSPGCDITCTLELTVTDEDGGTATCSSTVTVDDTLAPNVGTPAALAQCYPTLTAAREAACAATLAVSNDQCDPELTCDTNYAPPEGVCQVAITATITDDCGGSTAGPALETIVDDQIPSIDCPDDITVESGDKICSTQVQDWLDSVTGNDNCPGLVIDDDSAANGFGCGFPPGTTTVTFTATDACGLTNSCTADITVEPLPRIDSTQKGSVLIFSKVEIKWDSQGNLIQDTFLDFANDADVGGVEVQAYFVNGDKPLEEITLDDGTVTQEAEPGWNSMDCRFHLTKTQPHYWSAARGSSLCQPFTALDETGPGRPDPENAGGEVLRGFVVMWAVKFNNRDNYWEEIRWNHLKGDALLVNYALGSAWEYNAYAAQTRCVGQGEAPLDCGLTDENGTCCIAKPQPGNLDFDGFQYDAAFDQLLLDFYASGSTAFSATRADGSNGVGVMLDTDLTLHPLDIDLRQDGEGPLLTKAEFEVFNQNEIKLSGLRKCICCWDQTMLSAYVSNVNVPNYFVRERLGTDKGYARIDAVRSVQEECDYCEVCGIEPRIGRGLGARSSSSDGGTAGGPIDFIDVCEINMTRDTALLGLSAKLLTFEDGSVKQDWAGTNLPGVGVQTSEIEFEETGAGVAGTPIITVIRRGATIQYDVPRGTDESHDAAQIPTRRPDTGKAAGQSESIRKSGR